MERDKTDKDFTNREGEKDDTIKGKLCVVNICEEYRTENDTTAREGEEYTRTKDKLSSLYASIVRI